MILRVLTLFLSLQVQILATHYDSTIIELEAKLFPKMLILNDNIQKESKFLELVIISKERDIYKANEFKDAIESNYPDTLMGKKVQVTVKNFSTLVKRPDAIIVLHHSDEELKKIANWANENLIVSFAYDPAYMEFGVLSSIYIGISTKPYLNKSILKKYKFNFNPYLLKLSKFR